MKRALLILLATVVALPLAGLIAAHFFLSEDALRTRAEAAVLKATGRELTIAGPIRLGWSLTPTIEADDVSFANPPGFSRPAMAHLDRIEARIGLLPLLSHRIEVNGLTLAGPDVLFERDANGRANWDFSRPPPTQPAPAGPLSSGDKFVLDVGEVAITNAKLGLRGAQSLDLAAPHLTYDPGSGRVAGDLLFRGTTLHLSGTARATAADLHVEGTGLKLALSGTSAGSVLVADVADLSSLSALAETRLPPLQNVHFETHAKLAPDALALKGLKLTSIQGDLAGTLTFAGSPRPMVRGVLHSTRFDLDALTPVAPAPAPAALGPAVPAAPTPPDARLIPDTPIPYAALRGADADLQLNADALSWRGDTYSGVVAHLALKDGKLLLDPASLVLGGKTLSARIDADAAAQTVGGKVDSPGLPAGPLSALFGGPGGASGTVDLHADLHGQGTTWRAVAATLQGSAGLAMVDGEIDNGWLLGKLQDALRAANLPIAAGGDSRVRCAAIRAEAAQGKVRLPTLTLEASKLKLDGTGTIDLAAETVDLHLRPTLLLGASLSVPVQVEGTLRAPKVTLDPGAISPGRVGISIGGKPSPDTCGPALASARGGEVGPSPSMPEPASRPLKPADLLRGLFR